MVEKPQNQEAHFDTDHPYAIVAGWLALPAIYTVFTLLGALIILFFLDPSDDFTIYVMDVIFIPIIPVIYYFWWKRKKILPHLMVFFFFLIAIRQVIYWINDISFNPFELGISIIWIVYFIRSKRVQQTFVK